MFLHSKLIRALAQIKRAMRRNYHLACAAEGVNSKAQGLRRKIMRISCWQWSFSGPQRIHGSDKYTKRENGESEEESITSPFKISNIRPLLYNGVLTICFFGEMYSPLRTTCTACLVFVSINLISVQRASDIKLSQTQHIPRI